MALQFAQEIIIPITITTTQMYIAIALCQELLYVVFMLI